MARMRIGDMLIKAGLIDDLQLQSALSQQRQWGGKLGDTLVNLGFLDEMMLWRGLSKQLDVPLVSLAEVPLRPELLRLIPLDMAERLEIIPLSLDDRTLTIATSDPNNVGALDEVAFRTGFKVRTVLAPAREVEWAIRVGYYGERAACPPPRMRRPTELPQDALPQNMRQIDPQAALPPMATAATPLQQIRSATPGASIPPGWAPPPGAPPALPVEEQLRQSNEMLRALVEMCIARGVFTREELWDRIGRR